MRSTWTDSRLDDFKTSIRHARLDEISARVDGLSSRIDGLQGTTIQIFVAIMAAMVTGIFSLAGLILTQI